jgi:phage terminase large subunit-like protein
VSRALEVASSLVSDQDGRRLGDVWCEWQWDDARAVLAPEDGAPRRHFMTRPKGASKSTDIASFVIGWLLEDAQPLDDAYVIAADRDQANRLLDRARGLVARSRLGGAVAVEATAIRNVGNGARVHALASDVAGGEGLLSPFIIVEELPNWASTTTAQGMWQVAISSVPKVPSARLLVIGHASDPAHWSYKVLERARASSLWRVHEVDGPLPWISAEELEEQMQMLLPSQHARRHLNRWVAGEDRLTSLDDVRACIGHDGDLEYDRTDRYVVSLDVGLVNDRSVAVVAHAEQRERSLTVVVDRLAVWRGTRESPVSLDEIESWVVSACADYGAAPLHFDPYQAQHLAQRLRRRRIKAVPFTFSQAAIGRLALTTFNLLRARLLDLPDNDALVDELAAVKLVERSPGNFRIDHERGSHDDQAIALAIAATRLVERAGRPRPRALVSSSSYTPEPDLDVDRRTGRVRGVGF